MSADNHHPNLPTPPVLGLILKGFPRISETFISNEILLLEQLGFRIHIFSMRKPRENFSHNSVRNIKARADYLPESLLEGLPVLLPANAALAARKPRAFAVACKTAFRRFLRTRKSATWKHLLQAGYLVEKLLPGTGVAHLHAHFAHSPTSVAMFASLLSGIPFSFTAHAKDIYTSEPRQLREKMARARVVITCTEYNRRYLSALANGAGSPIHRCYHGIDLKLFDGAAAPPHDPRPPYRILTVARLTAKKGLPTVLQALKKLAEQGIDFQHDLIGDGADRAGILAVVKQLGLETRSHWRGVLPHEKVLEYYRCSDLFVLGCEVAADGDRDGIPNVLMESMAMGVPVVSTDVSAIPELVQHERTGLLVPPGRPDAMAQAMNRLLTDTHLRARIIPAAKDRVKQNFDNRILVTELAGIYRQAMVV